MKKVTELTRRQRHVLVALLEDLEEAEAETRYPRQPGVFAGQLAYRLGFHTGPRQLGNGAKDGRSFSGYGASGKWVLGSLLGLEKRGLIRRVYRGDSRMMTNVLTPEGVEEARYLRSSGVGPREVVEVRDQYDAPVHRSV